MKTHTSQFKENISLIGKQLDSKITYELNGVVQTLTSEQLNSITPTFQGAILKSVMKELDLDSNVDIPLGTIINYKFGVLVDNAYEYLDFGNYIVYSSEKQEDTSSYKIICYDKMLNSMKQNENLGITYPINVRDYINALCTKIGLEFKNKNDEFANFDRILDKELYVGLDYTYRDILDELAQVTASTIGLNLDDKVEIKYPKVVGETKIKSGTNIQIKEDSNISLTSMKLDGKSTQETRSGKNLIDINKQYKVGQSFTYNGITITYNENGYITLNGTSSAIGDINIVPNNYTITLDKDIYLCFEALSGSVNIPSRGVSVQAINKSGASIWKYNANAVNPIMKVPYSDIASIKWIRVPLIAGLSFNNYKFRFWVSTENNLDYEPYGVMPSPDYPSEIENVKGKNLFDSSTFKIGNIIGEDLTIRVCSYQKIYLDAGTYTFSNNLSSNFRYDITINSVGNAPLSSHPKYSYNSGWKSNASTFTFTINEGGYLTILLSKTENADITLSEINGFEYQLEKGSVATRYVPYGNIQIVETGKNIAKFDQSKNTNINSWTYTSNVANNITATKKGTGGSFYATFVANVVKDEQYVFSTSTSNHISMYCYSDKIWGTNIKGLTNVGLSSAVPLKFTSNYTGQMIIGLYSTKTSVEAKDFQLEKGSTATDYEPYKEEVVNIDLKGNELCSLPNGTKDELIIKEGTTKIIKKIGRVVLDGVHNVFYYKHPTLSSGNKGFYRFKLPGKSISYPSGEVGTALSNYFVEVSGPAHIAFGNNSSGLWWEGRSEFAYIILEKTSLVEANKWLSTHNTIVYYELETPKEIDLEQTVAIKTYKKLTNISNSEDANMEISYISPETIDEEYLKDINVNFGEKFGPINSIVLSRSAESDNVYLQDEESIEQNGLCEIKIKDNQIMNWNDRSDYLPDILEKLDGLEYYLNDFSSTGIAYLDLCDRYNIKVFDNTYSCIMFNDEMKVTQGLEENVHTDMPEETETDYTKADKTDRKINNVSLVVDKQGQRIDALAEKVQDISNTIKGSGVITLTDCSKTPLYKLVITGDDNLLFPNSKVYPSVNTFTKNSWLYVNKGESDEQIYDLKIFSLRTLGNVKDEYILENTKATLIKRIGLNDNLEKYVLDEPVEIDMGTLTINLKEGTNTLQMPSFPLFSLEATYLLKNDYTDTFASTAYVNSEIEVTSDNILLESKSYTDKATEGDELISKINLDSTGAVKIDASKTLDLTGSVINMTADDVRIKSNRLDIEPEGTINLIDDGARNPNNPSASYIINSSWLETVSETEYNKLDATHKITSVSRDFHYESKNTISSSTGYGTYDGKILETLYKYPSTIWEYGNAKVGYENTSVSYSGITTPQLTQTSLAEKKKNFSKYEGALEEIKKIDIYKYNLKFESDDTKKHLGFVIGEGYNYSEVITDNKNEGVDNYSMTSLCLQAIKEQQKIIEDLQKKINSIIMDKESDK